jgi:hypothetical protein
MLDMLLTADSARKHGHAYASPQAPSSPTSNASFLVQMPLSIIGSVLRRQTPSPSLAGEHSDRAGPTRTASDAMTVLPDTPLASPAPSRPASSAGSSATFDDLPKQRGLRSKTSYICARPVKQADCLTNKLHLRPKVLLQLHQVIASQRPRPTYEVVPFSLIPPRSTRRLARTFNTREKLGPNDLLVVKAEGYGHVEEEAKPEEEHWGSREVVGVICPAKGEKGVTEICMDDGASRWEVTNMSNGGFEFNTTDDHGLTLKARWVPKPLHSRRVSGMSASSQLAPALSAAPDDKKYTFSTISASSRRHPIIATMTRNRIDVMDSYTMPSATSPPTPGSLQNTHIPALTPGSIDTASFFQNEHVPIHTDDALRRFILVTAVWVASQNYSASSTTQPPTPSLDTSSTFRTLNSRTVSLSFLDSPRSTSPASTVDDNHRSIPRLLRSGRERLPRSTSFTDASPSPALSTPPINVSPKQKSRSRRANSTGTANLHSISGSMRKRYGLAFEGEALPETEEERQVKRSVELLRIKELAIPSIVERFSSEISATSSPTLITAIAIPPPVVIAPSEASPTPTPLLSPPLLSLPTPDPERSRKTQSAYNPITTTGLWDSGVTEPSRLKSRPTSMSVIMEKQKKQDRKREKSKKSKQEKKAEREKVKYDEGDYGSLKKPRDWHRFKSNLRGLFRREKA